MKEGRGVAGMRGRRGKLEAEVSSQTWGRMATLLQKGNAAILCNRVPCFPDAAVDGLQ